MTSITLGELSKRFGDVAALGGIDLAVESGEFFTLLGPSGCGKTTLLRIVAGFERQDSGSVRFGGEQVDDVPAHRRNTGMVFQSYALFPHMTVFENVAFGLRTRGIASASIDEKVRAILETVRLTGLEERTPDRLSGGQQQRVGIARAMVIEPYVLLMDEPLSNLDAKLRVEMREEIREIQRKLGTTTIYVTHDQEEALAISDRIAVLRDGSLQQIGRPWEVYQEPANAFVASFVGRMNFLDSSLLERVTGEAATSSSGDFQAAIRPEDLVVTRDEAEADGLAGTTAARTFTGSLVRYGIDCAGGLRLLAQEHRPAQARIIQPGTPVRVRAEASAVLRFDPESGRRVER